MGGDGGSIPKRVELVRQKKKPEKVDRKSELAAKWMHCALSQEPLRKPIVACELGRLYNKDKIIELLLDRGKFENPEKVEHIKGLKDVKELNLTLNPAYKEGDDKAESYVERACQYICPISGLEMTGFYKFQFMWGCGCVFSERALKEVKPVTCNKCGAAFKETDVVTINTENDEEESAQRQAMFERRLQAKQEKKNKKKKASETAKNEDGAPSSKKSKSETSVGSKVDTNGKLDGQEKKVSFVSEKYEKNNGSSDKSRGATNGKTVDKKKPKSIQEDPTASKVFKSLFSSSKEAKSKGSAHWVTHNPFYN